MKIQIYIRDEKGILYEGEVILKKVKTTSRQIPIPKKKKNPSDELTILFQNNYFSEERTLQDVTKKMKEDGYNFGQSSIYMALTRANYLKQKGKKGKFRFVQKYPP